MKVKRQDDADERREDQNLEKLLLEGLESGEATPLTKRDFDEIRRRGLERLKRRS